MKTTYLLTTDDLAAATAAWMADTANLKPALVSWMTMRGTPVTATDDFTLDADGTVTIEVAVTPRVAQVNAPVVQVSPIISPAPPLVPTAPATTTDRARCDKFTSGFTFPAECAYRHGTSQRIPEDVISEDVPGDNGGLTKWGIDQGSHPGVDIRNLTMTDALGIYYQEWTQQRCNTLPLPIGEVVHDTFESGGKPIRWLQQTLDEPDPHHAIHWLQSALSVTVDGELGPLTLRAVQAVQNPDQIAKDFLVARDAYFNGLADRVAHDAQFRAGWLNRDRNLRAFLGLV